MSTYTCIAFRILLLLASTSVNTEGHVRPKLGLDVAFRDLFGENSVAKSERESTDSEQDKRGNLVAHLLDLGSLKKRTLSNLGNIRALNEQLQQLHTQVDGQSSRNSADSLKTAVQDYLAKRGQDQFVRTNGLDSSKRATRKQAAESFGVFDELLKLPIMRDGPSQIERRGEIWDSDFWKRNPNGFQNDNFYTPMTKKSNNDANVLWFPFKRGKFLETSTSEDSVRSKDPFYFPGGGESERSLIDFSPLKPSSIQGFRSFNDVIKRTVNTLHPVVREQNSNFEDSSLVWPFISTGKEQKRNGQFVKSSKEVRDNTRDEPLINAVSWFPAGASRLSSKRSWRNPPESELNEDKLAADDLGDSNDIWSLWGAKRSTGSKFNVKNLESLLSDLNLHQEAKNIRRETWLHPLAKRVMSSLANLDAENEVI